MGIRVLSTLNNKMRLLIVHDVMNRIDETLNDLRWAGLPRGATARVISTVQIMAPAPEALAGIDHTFTLLESELEKTVKLYCRRLQEIFPEWEIRGLTAIGPPTPEALDRADEWNPDLIVVGADDHSLLERLFWGSFSSYLVRRALCSVRVARGRARRGDPHTRLLIGVDGSEYAEAAAREVAARSWPAGTEARLVTAIGPFFNLPTDLLESEFVRAHISQQYPAEALRAAGLEVSQVVKEDDATQMIMNEAENWQADCIFVGQRGLGFVKRMILGSVSSTVVEKASCSVEVVRADELALNAEALHRQSLEIADQIMLSMAQAA